MSIPVVLADLEATVSDYPWGYFVSVSERSRAHLRAIPTRFVDGVLLAEVGDATRRNITERPDVTMVFPPQQPGGMSLIVDGHAELRGTDVALVPSAAVLHRAALRDG